MGYRICTGETALSGKNNRKTEEKQLKKLIIIPAYNEEANIVKTVESIERDAVGFDYIVINDCSTDRTKEICEEHGFHYVDLPINLGIGGVVQTGYKYAWENGYDMAVQVDGAGQHDPEFLELMAEYLETHQVDMVIGSRFIEKQGFQSSGMRRVGIRFFSGLIRLMTGKTITDPTSGLRMAGRNVIELLSKGLSGTGKCCGDPPERSESSGGAGDHAGTRGRCFLDFHEEISVLYGQSDVGDLDRTDSSIRKGWEDGY